MNDEFKIEVLICNRLIFSFKEFKYWRVHSEMVERAENEKREIGCGAKGEGGES